MERLNGFAEPLLTEDIAKAKKYSSAELANEALEKLMKVRDGLNPEVVAVEQRSPLYLEGWGEPRSTFRNSNVVFGLYMRKDNGKICYAYTGTDGKIATSNYDGEAVAKAFSVAVYNYMADKIKDKESHVG